MKKLITICVLATISIGIISTPSYAMRRNQKLVTCVNNETGALRFKKKCNKKETRLLTREDYSSIAVAGTDGLQGATGPQGDAGPKGPVGGVGAMGPAGQDGAKGPAGPQGPIGPDGVQGPDGLVGPEGEQGDAGQSSVIDMLNSGGNDFESFSVDEVVTKTANCSDINNTVTPPPNKAFSGYCRIFAPNTPGTNQENYVDLVLIEEGPTEDLDGWSCTWKNTSGVSFGINLQYGVICYRTTD